MTEIYDTIQLSGEGRNAEYLGTFVAWLVINNLLDPQLELAAGAEASRVRMQDLTGSAFLTRVLHGELRQSHLNDKGRKFVEQYFQTGDYRADFMSRDYHGENEWILYDEMAPKITSAWRRLQSPIRRRTAKILNFPGSKR